MSITSAIVQNNYTDFNANPNTNAIYLTTSSVATSIEFSIISCNPEGSGSFTIECVVNGQVQSSWTMTGKFAYCPNMFFPFLVSTNEGVNEIYIRVRASRIGLGAAGYFLKATALKR